jgi:hypothetical protein
VPQAEGSFSRLRRVRLLSKLRGRSGSSQASARILQLSLLIRVIGLRTAIRCLGRSRSSSLSTRRMSVIVLRSRAVGHLSTLVGRSLRPSRCDIRGLRQLISRTSHGHRHTVPPSRATLRADSIASIPMFFIKRNVDCDMTDAQLSQEASSLVEGFHDICVWPRVCLNFYLRLDPSPLYTITWNPASAGQEMVYLHKGCRAKVLRPNLIRRVCPLKVVVGLDGFLCKQ